MGHLGGDGPQWNRLARGGARNSRAAQELRSAFHLGGCSDCADRARICNGGSTDLAGREARGDTDQALRAQARSWREFGCSAEGLAYARRLERVGRTREATRVRAELADPDGYLAAVAALPRPTPQQIADYACFVSECHSWYKHLCLTPGEPFQLYLSPHPDGYSSPGHYASHPADFHVEHFGHFEFARPSLERGEPRATLPSGAELRVPEPLLELGAVDVTVFLHPSLNGPSAWWRRAQLYGRSPDRYGLVEFEQLLEREAPPPGFGEAETRGAGASSEEGGLRERWIAYATHRHSQTLAELRTAMHQVCDVVYGPLEQDLTVRGKAHWFEPGGSEPLPPAEA